MHKTIFFVVLSIIMISRTAYSLDLDDIKNKANDFLSKNKDKISDYSSNIKEKLQGLINSNSQNTEEMLKEKLLGMMLQSLQKSLSDKNSSGTNNLDIGKLMDLLKTILQMKTLFEGMEKEKTTTNDNEEFQKQMTENLLKTLLESQLKSSNMENNEGSNELYSDFLKNLAGVGSSDPSLSANDAKTTMKDLLGMVKNLKQEINEPKNQEKLSNMMDMFKDLMGNDIENEEDNGQNRTVDKEKMDTGLIMVISLIGVILLVLVLVVIRRIYKRKQYMANRMIQHKPLSSNESDDSRH